MARLSLETELISNGPGNGCGEPAWSQGAISMRCLADTGPGPATPSGVKRVYSRSCCRAVKASFTAFNAGKEALTTRQKGPDGLFVGRAAHDVERLMSLVADVTGASHPEP